MKRLLAAGLAALMLLLLPAAAVAEDGQRALCLGISAFSGGGTEALYFGAYEDAPVRCRVLSTVANDKTTPGLFVLSEYLLGKTMFDTKQSDSNVWMNSVARNRYCRHFYEESFIPAEQDAILKTSYTDERYSSPRHDWNKCRMEEDTVFFLSVAEAENPDYGFDRDDDATRLAYNVGDPEGQWWRLRSPSSDSYYDTSVVGPDGKIGRRSADHIRGARPAWNIDAGMVLFASDAAGFSGQETPGALLPVPEQAPDAWRLTVFDEAHASFTASTERKEVSAAGESVKIAYSGAPLTDGTFVSAILTNADGEALLYGRLVSISSADQSSGTLDIALPALDEGDYTLSLFSETERGKQRTNTGSRLVSLPLTAAPEATATPQPTAVPTPAATQTPAAPEETTAPAPAATQTSDASALQGNVRLAALLRTILPILIAAAALCLVVLLLLLLRHQNRRRTRRSHRR